MIFVLGGEGFLGSAFVAELERRRQSVVAITRRNYSRFKGRRCSLFINANGNPLKFLAEKDPAADFDLAVRSTLASLLDFDHERYIYISSTAVYPDPSRPDTTREDRPLRPPFKSRYGFHRTLSEQLVQQYARKWLILRLGGLIGPGMKKGPVFDLLNGARLRVHPRSRFQFIDTRDIATAALAVNGRQKANGIFNIAGRGAVAMSDLARLSGLASTTPRTTAPPETWNVSIHRIRRFAAIPSTRDAVRRLITEREIANR